MTITLPFSLFTDPNAERVLVAEIQPYSIAAAARVTKYVASEWVLTGGSDTPANQHYEGSIFGDVTFRRDMFNGDNVGGRTIPDRGTLELVNTYDGNEGYYDDWLDPAQYTWQAAPCAIYIYDKADGFSSKVRVFNGVMEEPTLEENVITFPLRNNLQLLDKVLQSNLYDDTYGDDLNGKPKPLAFGWIYNAPAVLQENRIYQIHDGEIESITAVRDRGAALALDTAVGTGGDVANRAALVSASPASGKYCTCVAEGLIKVGLEPDGELTVDGKGSTLGGSWSALAGDIYAWIVETKLAAGTLASGVVARLNATGYALSYYTGTTAINAMDMLDDLLGNISVWYGANRAGEFDAGIFGQPAVSASFELTESEIDRDSMTSQAIAQVTHKIALNYRRNWTPQSIDGLASGIGEANKRLYSTEWQTVDDNDAAILTPYPEAVEKSFYSHLYDQVDAETEAEKLMNYWKVPRKRYVMRTSLKPLQAQLGDTVEVTHSRFNLAAGKNLMIIAFKESYLDARTEITVAG